jgi:hypothetical protein
MSFLTKVGKYEQSLVFLPKIRFREYTWEDPRFPGIVKKLLKYLYKLETCTNTLNTFFNNSGNFWVPPLPPLTFICVLLLSCKQTDKHDKLNTFIFANLLCKRVRKKTCFNKTSFRGGYNLGPCLVGYDNVLC